MLIVFLKLLTENTSDQDFETVFILQLFILGNLNLCYT